jgi:cell division protein FtsW
MAARRANAAKPAPLPVGPGMATGWARLKDRWAQARAPREERLPVRDHLQPTLGTAPQTMGFDQALVTLVLALLALGLVMVYSASVALPDSLRFSKLSPTHFLSRHLLSLSLGMVAALIIVQIPMAVWERFTPYICIGTLALLVLVLVPAVSPKINGARRWLPLGVMYFQPSELAKLAMCLYAASYMVRKMDVKGNFWQAVWPMAVALALVGLLLLAEPDMGAFMVIAAISLGILFLGGVNGRMFALGVAVLVGAFVLMIALSPWRAQRIFAYLDPWNPLYAQGKAYQLTHSLIAFGRGQLFGQGLGDSVEKLHYLPEAHTDFLLAVIGEELGFIGVLCVIVAFFWLTRRIFQIGRQAIALDRVFAGLMAQGVAVWIGIQSFINMGVNLGVLPTKGLTLPLLSYGGSAILMNLIALGIVLRVDVENRQLMRGGRT